MTIKLPKRTFADRLLASTSKRRIIRMPFEVYEKLGLYVYAHAVKESFWRALVRPRKDPPEGWVYPDQIIPGENCHG